MKADIFLEYYDFNDDKFNVNEYYSDSNSYIEALNKYAMQEGAYMDIKDVKNDTKYARCSCEILNEDMENMDISTFVSYYNTEGMVMLVLNLDLDNEEEEFDTELNNWVNEHIKLDNIPNLSEDKRMLVEPKRDIKIIFKNLANKDTYCILSNTVLLDKIGITQYAILVDKVIFTTKF